MHSLEMLDPALIRGCKLHDVKRGSVFQALRDAQNVDEPAYLGGSINDVEVLIEPRAEVRFHTNRTTAFANRVGYAIDDVRVEVDRSRAEFRVRDEDYRRGDMLIHPSGVSVFAGDNSGNHVVSLVGEPLKYERGIVTLAFRRWEIVIGRGPERHVLYHYTGEEFLFGPFDPETDEEV